MSLEGGDLSELRADDLESSIDVNDMHSHSQTEEDEETSGSYVVSNLARQLNQASTTAMKARENESDDSIAFDDSTHPALQMPYR